MHVFRKSLTFLSFSYVPAKKRPPEGGLETIWEMADYFEFNSDDGYTGETSVSVTLTANHVVDAAELNFLAVG